MNLGNTLRKLLELHNISQKDLAKELTITPSALSNYIQNTREPDYTTLMKMADYFHVTTDFLLGHTASGQLSHDEMLLINTYRSLTEDQQYFYLEQGKIFIQQNERKREKATQI